MYETATANGGTPAINQSQAIQDPARAWFLARIQALRDLSVEVEQMGVQGDERGKTAGELAKLLTGHLQARVNEEWEGYIDLAASKSPNLAASLRTSGPPIISQMVEYQNKLKLPTATWLTLTAESGGLWNCPGDGVGEGFEIIPPFEQSLRPTADDQNLVISMVDRRHVATAALHKLLSQFASNSRTILAPCDERGGWRRLKYLSQHYRQMYQLGLSELPADDLSGWDKDEVVNYNLADAVSRIDRLASTSLAIRVLSLGAVTTSLAEWFQKIDSARPNSTDLPQTDRLLAQVDQWTDALGMALQSMNAAVLLEQGVSPSEWDATVIHRPLPGTIPVLHAQRKL